MTADPDALGYCEGCARLVYERDEHGDLVCGPCWAAHAEREPRCTRCGAHATGEVAGAGDEPEPCCEVCRHEATRAGLAAMLSAERLREYADRIAIMQMAGMR